MKTVLAYSGGLDTTVLIRILQKNYSSDVVTVYVDVGQSKEDRISAKRRANELGVLKHYEIDAKEEFVRDYCFKSVKANASYEGYPLSTALARPLIAKKIVEIAEKERADAIAHGCTGKGNDQFRFENFFRAFSNLKIIAPIRELNLTREQEIAFAKKERIPVEVTEEKPYSVDENIWGRSIEGGVLEDPSFVPPDDIYEWTKVKREDERYVEISFEKGIPIRIDGKKLKPVDLVNMANVIAGEYGIGRVDIVEDRIIGLKSREIYEVPGATIIIDAHRALESLTLTKDTLQFKGGVDTRWSELVYFGLWHEPLKDALEMFIERTQEDVSGDVKLKLSKYSSKVVSRSSPNTLHSRKLVSFDDKTLNQRLSEGAVRFHGIQAEIYRKIRFL